MHKVHYYEGGFAPDKLSTCCGKTWDVILQEHNGGFPPTHSSIPKPQYELSPGGVWCCDGPWNLVPQAKKYVVHKLDKTPEQGGVCVGCGIAWSSIPKFHLWTQKDSIHLPDSEWCPGVLQKLANPKFEFVEVQSKQHPTKHFVDNKATCMICGWPRLGDGPLYLDGAVMPVQDTHNPPPEGVNLYTIGGALAKIVCPHHCHECHQPDGDCQCCNACHKWMCECGQSVPPIPPSPGGGKIVHILPHGSNLTACCGINKTMATAPGQTWTWDWQAVLPKGCVWCSGVNPEDYEQPSTNGYHFSLPAAYKCYKCNKHMKNCACPEGPTNSTGEKKNLTQTLGDGQVVTIQTRCMVPPWIDRGQIPELKHTDVDVAWPNIKPWEHDPVQMAADFYLYQAITSGALNTRHDCEGPCHHHIRQLFEIENPPVLQETRAALQSLIEEADLVFREYVDMACGGELRHHGSVGPKGVLSETRKTAWAHWRDVRDLVGTQALLDMAELFIDQNNTTGGVCGQKWRAAALLLHGRLTGKITPVNFVDQVFSLVHNGGVFLNKRRWKCENLGLLQGTVLPAQARDDFHTLIDYASPEASQLWMEAWRSINFCRIRAGVRPAPFQRVRSISICQKCGLPTFRGHMFWACRGAGTTRVRERILISDYRSRRHHPRFSGDFKHLWLRNTQYYRCSLTPDLGFRFAQDILNAVVTVPDNKRTITMGDFDRNFLSLPVSKFKGQEWKIRDLIEIHGLQVQILNNHDMVIEEVDA